MKDTFYITTAIDYTNAAPHIGHAYEKVLADTMARYHRLRGEKVWFLTGVDQHGQKVKQSAEKEGVPPQEFADRKTELFLALWRELGISHDGWAATSDPRHTRVVQAILQRLHDQGQLYKTAKGGHYSVRQEQFLTDKERGEDGAFGPEWGEVVYLEEENWYFRLSEHLDWLREFLHRREGHVIPSLRRAELLNAVERTNSDLCISRPKARLEWGIELPFDRDYVTYVWFDALVNYLSFAGYLREDDSPLPDFDRLWPADVHVIGKDIVVPAHGVYWPVMLHAMGFEDDRIPPLLVHGWWNIGGAKMSKSSGNVIDPIQLCHDYGASAVRYYLMRDIATGQDADFLPERLAQRYTADLANGLGNLLNRALNMTARYRDGKFPAPAGDDPAVAALQATAANSVEAFHLAMEKFLPHAALEAVWELVDSANGFVEEKAPWKLAKDPAAAAELDQTLYALGETLRLLSILIAPVMPGASAAMRDQLGLTGACDFEETKWGLLPGGHQAGKGTPLFPRIELEPPQKQA